MWCPSALLTKPTKKWSRTEVACHESCLTRRVKEMQTTGRSMWVLPNMIFIKCVVKLSRVCKCCVVTDFEKVTFIATWTQNGAIFSTWIWNGEVQYLVWWDYVRAKQPTRQIEKNAPGKQSCAKGDTHADTSRSTKIILSIQKLCPTVVAGACCTLM